jgi:threo-3-hydroxy-L-aspartate ammonia-lyase
MITLEAIGAAARRISPYVNPTPLVAMTPTGVRLKAENLHPIGAFKIRGAFNAILSLTDEQRARGVIAYSSGNHAQAVAYAAHVLAVTAIIVMPRSAPKLKLANTRRWGAEIVEVGLGSDERREKGEALAAERGLSLVPPYDSLAIIAGTGTIGLEILEDFPDVEVVAVPVSGGGLIAGVSAALKLTRPNIRVIGVEPELANDAAQSFAAGKIVAISAEQAVRTISDGLRSQSLGENNWPHVQAYVDEIVTVSEDQIKPAVRRIAAETRLVAEPSGATALAGLLTTNAPLDRSVAVLSGGNLDPETLAAILTEA